MVEVTDAAKKLAEEMNLDPEEIEGTGRDGNVTVEDIRRVAGTEDSTDSAGATDNAGGEEGLFPLVVNKKLEYNSVKVEDREFFRQPNRHPEGPEAQLVNQEEYERFSKVKAGKLQALVKA